MDVLRILHLSDLHIVWKLLAKLPEPFWMLHSNFNSDILEGLAKWIVENEEYFDVIVISGDLTQFGSKDEFERVRDFLGLNGLGYSIDQKYLTRRIFRPTIAAVADKEVFLIPGNHDRFRSNHMVESTENPDIDPVGADLVDQKLVEYWPAKHSQTGRIVDRTIDLGSGPKVVLLGADFSLRTKKEANTKLGRFGQGIVHQDVLDELKELTDQHRRETPGIHVVWVVHFPPTYEEYCQANDKEFSEDLWLLEGQKLVDAAGNCEVVCMLTGHVHKADRYDTHGNSASTSVIITGAACCHGAEIHTRSYLLHLPMDEGQVSVDPNYIEWVPDAARGAGAFELKF